MIRQAVTDRYYKVFTYQTVDRVTDMEFGFWPQTIRRWLSEGMPVEMTPEETNQMFSRKVQAHFGMDRWGHGFGTSHLPSPPFAEEVLERRERSVVKRMSDGIVAEVFTEGGDDASIPHYISFPVTGPDDWKELKPRFAAGDPARAVGEETVKGLRQARDEGKCIGFNHLGFFGQLRYWMGLENLSFAYYDYPEMVEEMVDVWATLAVNALRSLPDDIVIDSVNWWEDLAGRNGPLVSPDLFRRFFAGAYRRVMDEANHRGCAFATVDSDGDPTAIIPIWMELGVNVMHPMEVAAGADPFAWRKEYGREIRLRGGIDKRELAKGRTEIDRELERIRPLLDQGGYIPHLDHSVPPDVSYNNYRYYRERKCELIGKSPVPAGSATVA